MRRTRKPRVVWLPQTNRNSIGDPATGFVYQGSTLQISGATGDTGVVEFPLVLDNQQSAITADETSLSDIENSGYRLRRIVGKVWVILGQAEPDGGGINLTDLPPNIIVTAGIMVRRADTVSGDSLGSLVGADQVSPALIENTGDPWVWRRSWFLGNNWTANNLFLAGGTAQVFQRDHFPQTNMDYNSAVDGPHVDQKTARIVGPEERLYFTWSATVAVESATNTAGGSNLALFTDLRVLGSLRTSVGNRRNASR